MRCDQIIGLTGAAREYLAKHRQPPEVCPHCQHEFPLTDARIHDGFEGMFGDRYNLYRYRLRDGGHAEEFLQTVQFSSGPMFFFGLKVYDANSKETNKFVWSEEAINVSSCYLQGY